MTEESSCDIKVGHYMGCHLCSVNRVAYYFDSDMSLEESFYCADCFEKLKASGKLEPGRFFVFGPCVYVQPPI